MRSLYAFLFVTSLIFTTAAATAAQARCWDTGHSLRCAPGCAPTKLPRFPGDSFSWRCRRQVPPPPRYDAPPPPRQPPNDGCGPGMYPATPTWCCEIGSVFRDGRCVVPERPGTYAASGQDDVMGLIMLLLLGLGALAWLENRNNQVAAAREAGKDFDADISGVTGRMHEEADRAEEILREFRKKMGGDA